MKTIRPVLLGLPWLLCGSAINAMAYKLLGGEGVEAVSKALPATTKR